MVQARTLDVASERESKIILRGVKRRGMQAKIAQVSFLLLKLMIKGLLSLSHPLPHAWLSYAVGPSLLLGYFVFVFSSADPSLLQCS